MNSHRYLRSKHGTGIKLLALKVLLPSILSLIWSLILMFNVSVMFGNFGAVPYSLLQRVSTSKIIGKEFSQPISQNKTAYSYLVPNVPPTTKN